LINYIIEASKSTQKCSIHIPNSGLGYNVGEYFDHL